MASPSLERTSRTLPSLPPEDHQDHRLAQSPHSLAIQRRIRSSRKPRLAASNLPLANPQPGSLRRETASGHTGGMKGLSRMWRNSLVRFLGEGWRQRHSLTRLPSPGEMSLIGGTSDLIAVVLPQAFFFFGL